MAEDKILGARECSENADAIGLEMSELLDVGVIENRDLNAEEREQYNKLATKRREYQEELPKAAQRHREQFGREWDASWSDIMADVKGTGSQRNDKSSTFAYVDRSGHEHRCLAHNEPIPRRDLGDELAGIDAGKLLRAMVLNETADLNEYERRSMVGGSDVSGGYLLDSPVGSQIIDLARANSVVMQAGAQTLAMITSELSLAKVTGDPSPAWRAEGVAVNSSNVTLGRATLRPKTLACLVPISIELAEDAPNASALILQTITASMAKTLDAALLQGGGGGSSDGIVGVRNYSGISTETTGSAPTDWTIPSNAIKTLLNANCPTPLDAMTWIRHPSIAALFDQLVATGGETILPTPWVSQVKNLHTTALPSTEGGGSNEHVELLGDWSQVVVGMRTNGMTVEVLREGSVSDGTNTVNATSQLMRLVRVYLRADLLIQQPGWLCAMTGLTTS